MNSLNPKNQKSRAVVGHWDHVCKIQ